MTREQMREVVWAPLKVWAGLCALLAITFVYARVPGLPLRLEMALTFSAAKTALIVLFFMQLREVDGLVRVAAMLGVIWASFLFLFTFADLFMR